MNGHVDRLWREVQPQVKDRLHDARLITLRVTGSLAYGTSKPDSDLDLRGIYLATVDDCLRLQPPQEQYEIRDPDVVVFEARKFFKLAAAANPNVLEVLWADPVIETKLGATLTEHRDLFLSKKVRVTYGGYAKAQLEKVQKGYLRSRSRDFRRDKFILHLFRLFEQGTNLLRTGDLKIRLDDPEALMWQATQFSDEALLGEFERLDAIMNEAALESPLPDEPDLEAVSQLLVGMRMWADGLMGPFPSRSRRVPA